MVEVYLQALKGGMYLTCPSRLAKISDDTVYVFLGFICKISFIDDFNVFNTCPPCLVAPYSAKDLAPFVDPSKDR